MIYMYLQLFKFTFNIINMTINKHLKQLTSFVIYLLKILYIIIEC